MRLPNGLRSRLGKPQVANFSLIDKPPHRADGFLDRNARIHAVQIKKVNRGNLQALQTGLAGALHVFGFPIHAEESAVRHAHISELRRNYHLVAALRDSQAHQFFVRAAAVHVGGVEHGDPAVDGVMNRGDGFWIVRRPV